VVELKGAQKSEQKKKPYGVEIMKRKKRAKIEVEGG